MKQISSNGKLLLNDSPLRFRLLGLLFAALGILSGIISIGLTGYPTILPVWQKTMFFAISMIALAIGIYAIYDAPDSRVIADGESLTVRIRRRGLLRREGESYLFSEIVDVYTVQKTDIDGAPVFSLRMRLTSGKEVALTNLWLHHKEELEANASSLKLIISK